MSVSLNTLIRFIFLMLFLSVVFTPLKNLQAEDQMTTKTIVVIGTGKIHGENSARAREEAIENGLVSAVEDVAVGLLPRESLARNFRTFTDLLDGRTGKFIQGYRVLAELCRRALAYNNIDRTSVLNGSPADFRTGEASLLGEFAIEYLASPFSNAAVRIGYRVLGATNIGLAPNDPLISDKLNGAILYGMPYAGVLIVH